ncbi:hypothetical protein [Terrarubrum flagellatum]|uniref:hypothetical protein n=1 Tax=Terrirubrum flagellatum TaxID=2895980 RepID=UPI003144F206
MTRRNLPMPDRADIWFVPGDEIVQPILVTVPTAKGPAIVDLAGCALRVEIAWGEGTKITLDIDAGIEIIDPAPPPADEGYEQTPHFVFRLSEAQSLTLPTEECATARIMVVTSGGVTMQTAGCTFRRVS